MIDSTHVTNTEIFALIPVLVFKLLNGKVFLKNRKDNRRKKIAKFTGKLLQNYK